VSGWPQSNIMAHDIQSLHALSIGELGARATHLAAMRCVNSLAPSYTVGGIVSRRYQLPACRQPPRIVPPPKKPRNDVCRFFPKPVRAAKNTCLSTLSPDKDCLASGGVDIGIFDAAAELTDKKTRGIHDGRRCRTSQAKCLPGYD
jgi:hypothetical protein